MRQGWCVIRGLGTLLVVLLLLSTLPAVPVIAAPVVSTCGDSGPGSLRAAIAAAVAGDIITFAVNCPSGIATQITLMSGALTITQNNLTIDATGHTIVVDGGGTTTVFTVSSGAMVTLNALTIQDGHGGSGGGGIYNDTGTLTVANSTLFANAGGGGPGGGIYNKQGTLTVVNSTFSSNYALTGGGIVNNGTLTAINTLIAGNTTAGVSGIGPDVYGPFATGSKYDLLGKWRGVPLSVPLHGLKHPNTAGEHPDKRG